MSAERTPPVQLVVVVSFDGLRRLVDWVAAGETRDERERRGAVARQARDELLARFSREVNQHIGSVRHSGCDPMWAWPQNAISRN